MLEDSGGHEQTHFGTGASDSTLALVLHVFLVHYTSVQLTSIPYFLPTKPEDGTGRPWSVLSSRARLRKYANKTPWLSRTPHTRPLRAWPLSSYPYGTLALPYRNELGPETFRRLSDDDLRRPTHVPGGLV